MDPHILSHVITQHVSLDKPQRYGPNAAVTSLDSESKTVTLADGSTLQYDALITTMPLDITLAWLGKKEWADTLTHRCGVSGTNCTHK